MVGVCSRKRAQINQRYSFFSCTSLNFLTKATTHARSKKIATAIGVARGAKMEEEDKEEESLTTGVNKEDVFVPKKEDYLLSFSFSTGLRDASYQSNRGP